MSFGAIARRHCVELVLPHDPHLGATFRAIPALTWSNVTEKNRVAIIQDKVFFDAAQQTVAMSC